MDFLEEKERELVGSEEVLPVYDEFKEDLNVMSEETKMVLVNKIKKFYYRKHDLMTQRRKLIKDINHKYALSIRNLVKEVKKLESMAVKACGGISPYTRLLAKVNFKLKEKGISPITGLRIEKNTPILDVSAMNEANEIAKEDEALNDLKDNSPDELPENYL